MQQLALFELDIHQARQKATRMFTYRRVTAAVLALAAALILAGITLAEQVLP
jgi:hypothetical protein